MTNRNDNESATLSKSKNFLLELKLSELENEIMI